MKTNKTPDPLVYTIHLTRKSLNHSVEQLPHEITERLRMARQQALNSIKTVKQAQRNKIILWLFSIPRLNRSLISIPIVIFALTLGISMHTNKTQQQLHTTVYKSAPISIDAVINEKIPLQAYLNEDFNQYIEETNKKTARVQHAGFTPNKTQ